MKIVILITVIESLVVMLAIMYFYYSRSRSGKRALVLRRPHVSVTKQARLALPLGDYSKLSLPNKSGHNHDI
jgi:hypothetical protein